MYNHVDSECLHMDKTSAIPCIKKDVSEGQNILAGVIVRCKKRTGGQYGCERLDSMYVGASFGTLLKLKNTGM